MREWDPAQPFVLEFTNACPLLATEDPYAAASIFSEAGWKVEYDSARDGDQPGRVSR